MAHTLYIPQRSSPSRQPPVVALAPPPVVTLSGSSYPTKPPSSETNLNFFTQPQTASDSHFKIRSHFSRNLVTRLLKKALSFGGVFFGAAIVVLFLPRLVRGVHDPVCMLGVHRPTGSAGEFAPFATCHYPAASFFRDKQTKTGR